MSAQSLTFSIGVDNADLIGRSLTFILHKWEDVPADGETIGDGNAQPAERVFTAFTDYTIVGDETFDQLITVDFAGGPIPLEPGATYLAMMEWSVATEQFAPSIGFTQSEANYSANVTFGRIFDEVPERYNVFLGIGDATGSLQVDYNRTGFGEEVNPIMRLNIADCFVTSTENVLNDNKEFVVYPNPVQDELNLRLELIDPAEELTFQLFDIAGRLILEQQYDNVFRETFTYDTSKLNPWYLCSTNRYRPRNRNETSSN